MIGVAQAMRFPTFNLTALFGVASYLEVLDSERTLFDVSLNASATLQFRLNSYVNLYKVLGGGWVSEEEKKAAGK
jgi:outer membrane protein, multidrug efflux system